MAELTLVTGGAGFVGSHLVQQLVARGERVRILDRPEAAIDHLPQGIEVTVGDIQDRDSVASAVRGCRFVYHLAANPQLWSRRRGLFRKINYLGTVNVLDAALAAGAERVLHCSTESILTRTRQEGPIAENQHVPLADVIGPYCRSKHFAEQYAFRLAHQGAPVVVVNPTLPIGPGDRNQSPPTQMMLDFCLGRRSAYLDADLNLIDVRDVANGMIRAMDHGRSGRRYLLGAENWSVKRVFAILADITGLPQPQWRVPYPVALAAAYVSELIADVATGTIPAATVTGVKLTRRHMQFDSSRSLSELKLIPRPVANSIREAVGWFQAMNWISPVKTANRQPVRFPLRWATTGD